MPRTSLCWTLSLVLSVGLLACGACSRRPPPAANDGRPHFAATIQPIAAIVRELAGARADVVTILPVGASPHTFEPQPSDVRRAAGATALIYVRDDLDGWAARLPAPRRIELYALLPAARRLRFADLAPGGPATAPGAATAASAVPSAEIAAALRDEEQEHGEFDPHFWMDPLAVQALLPGLIRELGAADPGGAAAYAANAERFAKELDALDAELRQMLTPVRGRPVFLFHPSMLYLLRRYELRFAGAIEEFPGREPSPRYVEELAARYRAVGGRALFTEPQLPRRPAEVLAEELGAKLGVLDPEGGLNAQETYADHLRRNARELLEKLQ